MRKFKKYFPWLVAGGAIGIAIATRQYYAGKVLLEIPTFRINGGALQTVLPSADNPLVYTLANGENLAVHLINIAEKAV